MDTKTVKPEEVQIDLRSVMGTFLNNINVTATLLSVAAVTLWVLLFVLPYSSVMLFALMFAVFTASLCWLLRMDRGPKFSEIFDDNMSTLDKVLAWGWLPYLLCAGMFTGISVGISTIFTGGHSNFDNPNFADFWAGIGVIIVGMVLHLAMNVVRYLEGKFHAAVQETVHKREQEAAREQKQAEYDAGMVTVHDTW